MPRINANRDSVDDRFSVLGFTVRTESPLYEIAVATDPTLFRADARARRVRRNFFSSRAQGALRARRGEAVYLLPQDVLANFVGSAKLYFGLATYREGTTAKPDFVQVPSEGNMYVGLTGLTERGLRRAVSALTPSSYGTTPGRDPSLEWGGDTLAQPAPAAAAPPSAGTAAARPNGAAPAAPAAAASLAYDDGFGAFPAPAPAGDSRTMTPVQAQEVLLRSYDGDLASQLRLFAETVQWVAGVDDTSRFPHSAICKLELWKNGSLQGWATGFYVGRRMLLTNAHVVNDADTLVVIPGKNGAGRSRAEEPFGRFTCTQMRAHERYTAGSRDFDMAVVHATQDAPNGKWLTPIEELRQSRPEGVGVCGYSARSRRTDLPGTIVNAVLNPDKQHVHRGFVRTISDENFQYDVQELAGSSGSPVYWIEAGSPPRAHVVGINAGPRDEVVNEGCRFTDAKVAWIRARAADWHESAAMALDDEPCSSDAPVQAMELLEQSYDGTLESQIRLFGQSAEWIAGVPDTRNFPHSAICFVGDIANGAEAEHGTAFFIGRHLLLTAGHVVDGMSRLVFVPGKNGRGIDATHEPFGRFEVALTSTNCFKYPGYAPTTGTDMALVYTGPANAAPGGRWFNIVEELRQSRPEGVGVCGYSQFSSRSGWLPALVNAISDPRKQHLHRGYVRTLPGNDLFTYDVQTLPGASGSPVYWIEAGSPPRLHMVGVHIAGDGDTTNRGCRMTDAKVAWLRAKAATFGEAHAFALEDSDAGRDFMGGDQSPERYAETEEASPDTCADTRPRAPRLAPPPAPIMQQPLGVDEPAAAATSETVAIASSVPGAAMQRTTVRRPNMELRLDQLHGLKHPGDQPPAQPRPLQDGAAVRLADWPKVNGADGTATAAPVEIRWQFDGVSLGNVQVAATATVAAGAGLRVGARILDDAVVYPRTAPAFAALRVRLDYAFESGGHHPIRAFQDVHLFGNGRYNIAGDWVRHGHADEGVAATALDTRSGPGSGSGSGSGSAAGSGSGVGSGSAAAPALPTFALPWEAGNAGRSTWTRELIAAVVAHKADLDRGNPDTFIPGYANLSADLQIRFWCEFLVAISRWESGWNPRDTFTEANGVDSIGLFALSYPDAQNFPLVGLDQARDTLKDPLVNLRAGVVVLSTLVARHRMVVGSATTGRNVEFKGGAAYWSVLRTERKHLADIRQTVKDAVGIH